MRFALLRQRPGALGGAENTLLCLSRELVRAGHEVTIIAAQPRPPVAREVLAGLNWHRVPVWPGKTGRILGFAVNARRLLHRSRFDIIFSLERTLSQDVYRAGDGCHREWLRRRQPYDTTLGRLHLAGSPFHQTLLWLEKRLFQDPRLKLVIANSRQVESEIRRHYRVPPSKIRVIYNGVDRERFNRFRMSELRPGAVGSQKCDFQRSSILFVGSGFRRKGLNFLIAAMAERRLRQCQLLVVGPGRTAPYQRLAQKLGIAGQVQFLGPQTRVENYYAVSRVLALPTIYDPCSNVVLEALACGLPVVTTSANGASEFIRTGENGVVLNRPDDRAALAAALEEFVEQGMDPRVQESAEAAVAQLSWTRTALQTLSALKDLSEF
ncbi:glycosyltransferase family 4 protein [Desulfobacca acetoxidans]